MPVRVTVAAGDDGVDGRLIAEWGDARVERAVNLSSRSQRTFELHLRTVEPGRTVRVRLDDADGTATQRDFPVRIADADEPLIACVADAVDGACAVAVPREDVPVSWRGFDAADEVRVGAATGGLSADQREALSLFRALRHAENAGTMQITSGVVKPAPAPVSYVLPVAASYVGVLLVAAVATRWLGSRSWTRYAALALIIATAGVVAAQANRRAPLSIQHASVVHEFDGVVTTRVFARARVVAPTDGPVSLHADAPGVVDAKSARGASAMLPLDPNGRPVLTRSGGLGGSWMLSIDLDGRTPLLSATGQGAVIRLTNVSMHPLTNCELAESFSPRAIASLAPGAAVELTGHSDRDDNVVTCTLDDSPIQFTGSGRNVNVRGMTSVVHHFLPKRR